MKLIKKLLSNTGLITFLLVLISGVLASRTLLFEKGYFNMHDDLQMMRQLEMEKCFKDGQIPCRWVPDMGYGFGFPLFNFYPPLPYLVGQVVRLLGFSFVDTAKILFALAIILSGYSMYYLASTVFKNKWAGVISSIFYVWAPYHAVDVYVRGAMNESWALIFFPLIFLFSYKFLTSEDNQKNLFSNIFKFDKWMILLSLSYFGLFTSHNLMIMIFTPFFAVWCFIVMYMHKSWNKIIRLGVSGVYSVLLSAFFTLPAIFENDLTWLKSQLIGYYDYTAHFVTLYQLLISRYWGYGPSVWLEYDRMAFPAGLVHWVLSIIILGIIGLIFFKFKKKNLLDKEQVLLVVFVFVMAWLAAFMTHVRSTPVYQLFPFLALVQFPWRFLTLVTFGFSFISGFSLIILQKFISRKLTAVILITTTLFVVIFNWNFFLPENGKMGKLTDQEKFSAAAWDLQQTAGIYDYLPLTAKTAPKEPQKHLVEVVDIKSGKIVKTDKVVFSQESQGTNWAKFSVENGLENVDLRIGLFEFPGWKVYVDGKPIKQFVPEIEAWGRMWINLPKGNHQVEFKFEDTPIRSISNIISLVSWLGLLVLLMLQFRGGKRPDNSRSSKTKVR